MINCKYGKYFSIVYFLDAIPVYGDDEKHIKTKIKTYGDCVITNFHNRRKSHYKGMPKEKAPCTCLSIIMLDSVITANTKYYPQTLEECKYVQENMNIENLINDNLEKNESDSGSND